MLKLQIHKMETVVQVVVTINSLIKSFKTMENMSGCVQFLKCMYVTVHYCMLLCGWWLHIQSIVSGIVFSVFQIPVSGASCVKV